jgi:hypothetical protein
VILAAEAKYSRNFRMRDSLLRDFAFFPRRRENDFGEFPAPQNFRVHFLVARSVAGVAACRVDNHAPAGIAGFGVEEDVAALELERAMNGVHRGAKCEFNGGAGRIEVNGRLLRVPLRRAEEKEAGGNA